MARRNNNGYILLTLSRCITHYYVVENTRKTTRPVVLIISSRFGIIKNIYECNVFKVIIVHDIQP